MGLQLLEREKRIFKGEKDFTPDFTGKEYLLERQLKPEARKDIIEMLRHAGIMTDGGDLLVEHAVNDRYAGARVEVPETDGVVVAARSRDGVPIRQTVHAIGMSI